MYDISQKCDIKLCKTSPKRRWVVMYDVSQKWSCVNIHLQKTIIQLNNFARNQIYLEFSVTYNVKKQTLPLSH